MTKMKSNASRVCAWLSSLVWVAACNSSSPSGGRATEADAGSSSTTEDSTGVLPTDTGPESTSTNQGSTGEILSSSSDASSGGSATGSSTTGGQLASTVVFVNFEGGEFSDSGPAATMTPYPFEEERDEILQRMRAHYAAFDVSIVTEPPGEGPYTTAVIGVPQTPTTIEGLGPLDCGNAIADHVVFTFYSGQSPARLAAIASSTLAVSFGVGHHEDQTDLAARDPFDDAEFLDICVTPKSGPECWPDSDACGDDTQQNSYQELLISLGPA